jgi:hypothetical protein
MTPDQYSKDLVKAIDDAVEAFNSKIPQHEKRVYKELLVLLKDLKTKNGKLINSVENLKTILKIKTQLSKLVLDKEYLRDLNEFTKAYDKIAQLQNQYFATFTTTFTPPKVLALIQEQSIENALFHLKAGGMQSNVVQPIHEMLLRNITTGGSYASMLEQVREKVLTTENGAGALRHVKCETTDALNTFSRAYTATITADLNLKWRMYVGSLLQTSRQFCIDLVDKRYYHVDEVPELLKGHIDGKQVPLNKKTGLPQGMYPDTTVDTFQEDAGGYCCGHQNVPVNEVAVPKEKRIETYKKLGIKYDAKGYAIKTA